MKIAMKAPLRYVQEAGIISELGAYTSTVGENALIVISKRNRASMAAQLEKSLDIGRCRYSFAEFQGEVTQEEAERLASLAANQNSDVIIGIGGGRVMDAARTAADIGTTRLIICPTLASSDAPCSAVVVIHNEDHQVIEIREVRRNPDLVLVDTQIVSQAPVRYLVAGMGDALGTYYEGRASYAAGAYTHAGAPSSRTAVTLGKLCRDILFEHADEAMSAVSSREINDALELLVHATIYLSCMGTENGGTAAAHAINDGFTAIPDTLHLLHGELVGFGVLCQLELENASPNEKIEARDFMRRVGLPISFEQMGLDDFNDTKLWTVSEVAHGAKPLRNMPFEISTKDIQRAILSAQKTSLDYGLR